MKKGSKRTSAETVTAMIMTALAGLLVLAMTVFLPSILDFYLEYVKIGNAAGIVNDRKQVLALLYAALVPVHVAIAGLFLLLANVRRDLIFTRSSTLLIGLLAVCCYAASTVFAVLSHYFILASVLCLAALLMGTLMLVVRSVIARATEIKAENDFTV